jgi:glucosamine--fructose-6-phosphate aminotransferase (isomerizing)
MVGNDLVTAAPGSQGDATTVTPGPRGALMEAEIAEQPAMLERLVSDGDAQVTEAVAVILRREPANVLLVGRGTSDHAALYLKYLIEVRLGLPVGLCSPSAHTMYGAKPWGPRSLVIGVSQSGGSPDLVAVLGAARAAGATTLALTNAPASDLALAAELSVDVRAGTEQSVAATKSYTAELLAAYTLVNALQRRSGGAETLPAAAAAALGSSNTIAEVTSELVTARHLIVTGRGYAYPTALEAALKLMETCYLPALAFSAADLRHGPFALLSPDVPAIVLTPTGRTSAAMADLVATIVATGSPVISVGPAPGHPDTRRHITTDHHLPDDLAPIVDIIPLQLLALDLARANGFNPDTPRSLRKVTETM